jgi:hypothetical protein
LKSIIDKSVGQELLIRYELIYERGGFWPEADSECYHDVSELFVEDPNLAYTVFEKEDVIPRSISPIMAANPGNKFLDVILRKLHTLRPGDLDPKPHESTGNFFLARLLVTYYISFLLTHLYLNGFVLGIQGMMGQVKYTQNNIGVQPQLI